MIYLFVACPGAYFHLLRFPQRTLEKIDKEMVHCSFCSIYFSSATKDSFGAMEAYPVLLFLFVFVAQKLPTIQYSFLLHKGLASFKLFAAWFQVLVVCCLQLQAERCPTILKKQIASDSLQGTRNRRWLQGKAMMSLQRKEYVREAKKWNWKLERLISQTFLLFLTLICNRFVRIHV